MPQRDPLRRAMNIWVLIAVTLFVVVYGFSLLERGHHLTPGRVLIPVISTMMLWFVSFSFVVGFTWDAPGTRDDGRNVIKIIGLFVAIVGPIIRTGHDSWQMHWYKLPKDVVAWAVTLAVFGLPFLLGRTIARRRSASYPTRGHNEERAS